MTMDHSPDPPYSPDSVTLIEESGQIGLFLKHDQNLELIDVHVESTTNSSNATTTTITSVGGGGGKRGNSRSSSSTGSTNLIIRRYELNPKLFAIQEPYLMKTERDALVKMIGGNEDGKVDIDDDEATEIPSENGSGKPPTKAAVNRARKRKRTLTKKVNYIDANLCSDTERKLASRIVEDCLQLNMFKNHLVKVIASSNSPTKSPNPKVRKRNNSSSSSSNSCALTEKTDLLLRHINTTDSESNAEAQLFVQELFKNRFESLNYRGKLFCNPYGKVIRSKFGLSNYLIPARCSFAGVDICEGIARMVQDVQLEASGGANYHLSSRRPFFVVMDPAWENRSVKRKKTYETVTLDYLRRMCRELKILLDLVTELKKNAAAFEESTESRPLPLIITGIWTTKADKQFVINEMLPSLGLTLAYELKWHKVTTRGCPVKIHGGLEYMIIAERWASTPPAPIPPSPKSTPKARKPKKGLLVSVPSAVHSHKPSPLPVYRKLYGDDIDFEDFVSARSGSISSGRSPRSPRPKYQPDQLMNYHLATGELVSPLVGVELFARYLQTGFHSIGYECIKLQNESLFTWSEVIVEA